MRRNFQLMCIALTVLLLFAGCKTTDTRELSEPEEQSAAVQALPDGPITREDLLRIMPAADQNWMNLTGEQYLEDLDSLYRDMKENYPYFGVVRRKVGVDIEALYQQTRADVEHCESDYAFLMLVRDFVRALDYTGHISLWAPGGYFGNLEDYREWALEEAEDEWSFSQPYVDALDNEVSYRNYTGQKEFLDALDAQVETHNAAYQETQDEEACEEPPNVETEILEEGKIAYVSIRGFPMDYSEDEAVLMPFYREIAGYDHLIIDITENGGGGMGYYNNLIAAPLAKEPLEVPVYLLTKNGSINRSFFLNDSLQNDTWYPNYMFPELPGRNEEDLAEMDFYLESAYRIEPDYEIGFTGSVWLLVSERNYSASEYAAMMSKHSGFATLVGSNTGGDGIGRTPVCIVLPNSGLVVQYSPIHGLSADGRGSEEFGTAPDLYTEAGETALQTCLRAIHEQQ